MSTKDTASRRLENIKHHLSPNEHPHFESSTTNDKLYIYSLTDIIVNSAYSKTTRSGTLYLQIGSFKFFVEKCHGLHS